MSEPGRPRPSRARKIGSQLRLLDCVSCDKCVPACPTGAMFAYATPVTASLTQEAYVTRAGEVRLRPGEPFRIEQPVQYGVWLDDCDECDDCDLCCPEDGGPYRAKARVHSSHRSFRDDAPRDGIHVACTAEQILIEGRLDRQAYRVEWRPNAGDATLSDGQLIVKLDAQSGVIRDAAIAPGSRPATDHCLPTHPGRTLLAIAAGMLDGPLETPLSRRSGRRDF